MTLRLELFPADLEVFFDFYTRVEDLIDRPWGLRDFRLLDPDGHFLRYTSR